MLTIIVGPRPRAVKERRPDDADDGLFQVRLGDLLAMGLGRGEIAPILRGRRSVVSEVAADRWARWRKRGATT